jgi:hypothetical protein
MKEIKNQGKLCDFCKVPAVYDAPTRPWGRWANMCEKCFEDHKAVIAESVGYKFAAPVAPAVRVNEGKTVTGIEDLSNPEYLVRVMSGEDDRSVSCPCCNDSRSIEIDARSFHCSCGAVVLAAFVM